MVFLKWDAAQPGAKLAVMSNKSKSQPQPQQQHQHQQHVIKPVDQVPPRYQPPPQPSSGILKNHLHFANAPPVSGPSSTATNLNQNHHQQHQPQPRSAPSKDGPKVEHHQQTGPKVPQQGPYLPAKVTGQGQLLPPNSQYPVGQPASRQRISDEDFLRLGPLEMLKFVRKTEGDIARVAAEQNRQIQTLVRLDIVISDFRFRKACMGTSGAGRIELGSTEFNEECE